MSDQQTVELIELIDRHVEPGYNGGLSLDITALAEDIIESGFAKQPQPSAELADLIALPIGARIFTPKTGNVWWTKPDVRGWQGSCGGYSYGSDLLRGEGPFVALWIPEEDA